jgi:hypothetical protein
LGFILSSPFLQLGLFVFVLSILRLELNLNLINLISQLGNKKTDGGGVQDEEDGIREYGIFPCFAGWVAWLGVHTSLLLWDFSGLVWLGRLVNLPVRHNGSREATPRVDGLALLAFEVFSPAHWAHWLG